MQFKTAVVTGFLFGLLMAGVALAAEWRVSEYFLPFFVVGKSLEGIKYSVAILATDNGGSAWNRGYSVFFRDGTGNPLFFPGTTFTGEAFSADSRSFYVYDRGTSRVTVPDAGPLTLGWMSVGGMEFRADETVEFQPPVKLYARIEARDQSRLLYSFVTDFKRPFTTWTVELVEKGTWVSILNPNPQPVIAALDFWDDKETSNTQTRGGAKSFTNTFTIGGRSTFSEFVEVWFPQMTAGRLEVEASLPIVTSAVRKIENLVTSVPISPGKVVKQ